MLADKLYQLNSFHRQYEALLILSVCDSISAIEREQNREELLSCIDWNNILGIASVLCQSQNSIHLDAALRIAQTCLSYIFLYINPKECSSIYLRKPHK